MNRLTAPQSLTGISHLCQIPIDKLLSNVKPKIPEAIPMVESALQTTNCFVALKITATWNKVLRRKVADSDGKRAFPSACPLTCEIAEACKGPCKRITADAGCSRSDNVISTGGFRESRTSSSRTPAHRLRLLTLGWTATPRSLIQLRPYWLCNLRSERNTQLPCTEHRHAVSGSVCLHNFVYNSHCPQKTSILYILAPSTVTKPNVFPIFSIHILQ